MNRFVGVGRLTRDVDLRYTANGNAVANFTIAIDRAFSKNDEADFINCVAWRATAENLANYMKKGSQIGVDGRLQTRTYEDKDGKTVFVTEVVADSVQFLDSRNNGANNSQQKTKEEAYNSSVFEDGGDPVDIGDDELPF